MKFMLLIILTNIIYSLSIKDVILANPEGEKANVIFFDNIEQKDKYYNDTENDSSIYYNGLWFEKNTNNNYVLKYHFITPIAGMQFMFNEINYENLEEHHFVNGVMKEKKFDIAYRHNSKILVAFSMEGNIIDKGEGELFEIDLSAPIVNAHQAMINNESEKVVQNEMQNQSKISIDITEIVFSDNVGQALNVGLKCHKEKCIDYCYSGITNPNNGTCMAGHDQNGTVNLELVDNGNNNLSLLYNSNIAIAGFQFTISGATIETAFGGDAETSDFRISTGNNTILAFSFEGYTIPKGSGTLVNFTIK